MSSKQKSQKIKIIQFKDVVSILLIFVILFLSVGSVLGAVKNAYAAEKVTTRDLIMFASLAYADLEKIDNYNVKVDSNKNDKPKLNLLTEITELSFEEYDMVSDEQLDSITSSTVLLGLPLSDENESTYKYLFYGLASTSEVDDWKLVNYTKYNTTIIKGMAEFTAMTFKRENDIVIAYRGTDFDDIGDWSQDIFYGLVGYAGQEKVAQDYAKVVAEHYINENPNTNIYITGHSLGGYLAQIGGATLVEKGSEFRDNVKEISYFNGMGLKFWSNIGKKMTSGIRKVFGISVDEFNQLISDNSFINVIQNKAQNALKSWKNEGNTLISYHIKGDIISSLGSHVGDKIGLEPYNLCIEHHEGNQIYSDILSNGIFAMIKGILNEDISEFVRKYRPKNPLKYIWITHETDSFFGRLPYADGTQPADVSVELNVPSSVKYNKKSDAILTIKTKNVSLNKNSLTKNDFITNTSKVKIDSIKLTSQKVTEQGYEYSYKVTLKGGLFTGNSTITLKPGALAINGSNLQRTILDTLSKLSNNIFESNNIKTKLR